MDTFPPEKQGTAMTLFGLAALIAPIVGPTLGGWLCVNYDWRWIFLHQRPDGRRRLPGVLRPGRRSRLPQAGAGRVAAAAAQLRRASAWGCWCWSCAAGKSCSARGRNGTGWATRSGGCRRCLILFVLGLGLLIFREMRIANPIINFRVLGERNFAVSCIIIFSAFAVLYCGEHRAAGDCSRRCSATTPLSRGWCMSPAGVLLDRR